MTHHDDPAIARPRLLIGMAMAGLGALMVLSVALGLVPAPAQGYGLAIVKLVVLGFLFKRLHDRDVYTMQWSSMLILLFMAEGLVRATSDPQPSAALGAVEAVAALVFFGAVLAYLQPIKRKARAKSKESS